MRNALRIRGNLLFKVRTVILNPQNSFILIIKKDVVCVQLGMDQHQKLTLSQQQIQALHILEMSAFELHSFLTRQSLENPFIRYESSAAFSAHTSQPSQSGDADAYLHLQSDSHSRVTLHEHLLEQATLAPIPNDMRRHVRFLIDRMDANGFLAMPLPQIAKALCVSQENAKAALRCLQSFSPAGVGARNLRECLLLQIKRSPSPDPLAFRIVHDHLDLLAHHRFHKIAVLCGVADEEVLRARDVIVSLNPKPGNGFASAADIPFAPPDLLVKRDENGVLTVSLNPDACFQLRIDADTARQIRHSLADVHEDAACIREKLALARTLEASLRRRSNTLLSCGEAIAALQQAYFRGEADCPNPCSMQTLAGIVGVHASTITRTLKNKTLRCDLGVHPLAFFFSRSSYRSREGEKSIAFIQGRIAALIRCENPAAPLSDQSISQALALEGIAISRRAVTKHREALFIPCSYARSGKAK